MLLQKKPANQRTPEQIKQHYEIEKALASKLKNASVEDRRSLYTDVYDELFRLVPHHHQVLTKQQPQVRQKSIEMRLKLLQRFLPQVHSYLEVGPGDCALSLRVAKLVKKVYAVDVSKEITKNLTLPKNFLLFISDGTSIPVPRKSIDFAFSDQLMEHLHPDDAVTQLKNIYAALKPGGKYLCVTTNKLSGPHDVSRGFDTVASGFHLKEYSIAELRDLFKQAGFSKVQLYAGGEGLYIRFPLWLALLLESMIGTLPTTLGKAIARAAGVRHILGIYLLGLK